jgi:hypothetical protein
MSCLLFKTWRLGDWILSPPSSGTFSVGPLELETETSSIYLAELSGFHLKTETESSLRKGQDDG